MAQKMFTQAQQVIDALREDGGYAPLLAICIVW